MANVAGCDISQTIRDIIGDAVTGEGCLGGCADCGACDCTSCDCACDCEGCEGCEVLPIPGGFQGAHMNQRIANAAQVRVTDSALNFAGASIPGLVGALPGAPLPYFPLDIDGDGTPEGTIRILLRNTDILTPTPTECDGNLVNGLGNDRACVRARMDVNYRTCDFEADPVQQATACENGVDTITVTVPIEFNGTSFGEVSCDVTASSDGVAADLFGDLNIEADIALLDEAIGPHQFYSRLGILDGELVNNAALEPDDVTVDCGDTLEGIADPVIFAAAIPSCSGVTRDAGCTAGEAGCTRHIDATMCRECDGLIIGGNCTAVGGSGQWRPCAPCNVREAVWVTIRDFAAEDGDQDADDLDDLLDELLSSLAQNPETILDNGVLCKQATAASDCPMGTTYMPADSGPAATRRGICAIEGTGDPSDNDPPPRCLAPLLGTEGRVNLGGLLASISPGLNAFVDFLFAAGGPGVTAGSGYNVNFFGGLENLAHDNCVPLLEAGDPGFVVNPNAGSGLPQVGAFQTSTRPGTGTPFDVGAAVSEEFANYALFKIWDSGMLCLTVTSALSSQLSPGMLGPLLFPSSVNRFLFPLTPAQSYLGLAIRPQQPPSIVTETIEDPDEAGDQVLSVTIALPSLDLDFIFWTNDRYTRLATIRTDLAVSLLLDMVANGANDELALRLGDITFENTSYRNASTLLSEGDLASDAGATLNSAAPLIAAGLAGSLPPIALEELINGALVLPGETPMDPGTPLPIRIDFTADSFLPFDEGTHPFFGVFFNLAAAGPNPLVTRAETSVQVTSLTIPEDRTAFAPETLGQGPLPRLEIAMDATGPDGAEFEFSYRTTFSGWSPWSRSRYAVIEDAGLVLQQHQQVFARARVVGAENSTDLSSATADFTIDVTEPAIQVTVAPNGEGELQAFDYVYGGRLEYRVDGGAWKAITTGVASLGPITNETVVEVRDGSGNTTGNDKLRGRGDPDAAAGGCGCVAAGAPASNGRTPAMLLGVIALGAMIVRRRR